MKKISIPYSALASIPLGWFVAINERGWIFSSNRKPLSWGCPRNWYSDGDTVCIKKIPLPSQWNKHLWQRTANNGNAKDFERVEI